MVICLFLMIVIMPELPHYMLLNSKLKYENMTRTEKSSLLKNEWWTILHCGINYTYNAYPAFYRINVHNYNVWAFNDITLMNNFWSHQFYVFFRQSNHLPASLYWLKRLSKIVICSCDNVAVSDFLTFYFWETTQ